MGKTGFSIRDYRESDFSALGKLWLETGVGRPDRGDDNETILRSISLGGKMLIMENDIGDLIGSSWMTFDGRRIHLHHFAILPSHQGRGLSKPLLERSLEFVKSKGFQVKLEVHQGNTRAIELYRNYGFKYLGDYDVYIIRDPAKAEIHQS